jgi:hypothetical protein
MWSGVAVHAVDEKVDPIQPIKLFDSKTISRLMNIESRIPEGSRIVGIRRSKRLNGMLTAAGVSGIVFYPFSQTD